ncbi:hypothetical protein ASPZODRAFT_150029 [Penicilliopsis zonata CBS 506.65]|uniref:Metallo-beta-lactamase domain-containing protein n=1 Tax=Penicilliopsis zonata CBS 506.65 TaxID=1073090 RepID=A0A1L9SPR6_9EURO|nr:hypothetical protein ASPZODRAFT_150029 [Penicilliopsis zonata CBS 506.65]OJJ49083.1 hypothetical protein ASPZODRAFT_150029 [Penicilliopsis zonata CBS 506.65]
MQHFVIDPTSTKPSLQNGPTSPSLPGPKETKVHSSSSGDENASLFYVGAATVIMLVYMYDREWEGIRLMTDPTFIRAGTRTHTLSTRRIDPAIFLEEMPRIDAILLSHYHREHFDRLIESSIRRDIPIITTKSARSALCDPFTTVYGLDAYEGVLVNVKKGGARLQPRWRVTAVPGKHGPTETHGFMVELGYGPAGQTSNDLQIGYTMYITGDTLFDNKLHEEIKTRYKHVDLMLVHLGSVSVPSPRMGALSMRMSMDGKQGVELIRKIGPGVTIPIHYDGSDLFRGSLDEFRREVQSRGGGFELVCLERGGVYRFNVST